MSAVSAFASDSRSIQWVYRILRGVAIRKLDLKINTFKYDNELSYFLQRTPFPLFTQPSTFFFFFTIVSIMEYRLVADTSASSQLSA